MAQSVNVSIGVTGTGGTPTGNVSLLTSAGQSVPGFTLANGNVTGTMRCCREATYNVTAHYAGDATYGGSDSNAVSVTVAKENSKTALNLITFDSNGNILNPNATTAVYGSPYLLRMNVTNAAGAQCGPLGGCATGTIALTDNSSPLDGGSFTLNSLGYSEDQLIRLPGGTNTLQALYAGDNSFNGSTGTSTITITPASFQTAFVTPTGNSNLVGAPFDLIATLIAASYGAAPGGNCYVPAEWKAFAGTVSYVGNPRYAVGNCRVAGDCSTCA